MTGQIFLFLLKELECPLVSFPSYPQLVGNWSLRSRCFSFKAGYKQSFSNTPMCVQSFFFIYCCSNKKKKKKKKIDVIFDASQILQGVWYGINVYFIKMKRNVFPLCFFLFLLFFWWWGGGGGGGGGLLRKLGLQKTAFVQWAQEMKIKFWWNTGGKCPFKSNPFIDPFVGNLGRLAWVGLQQPQEQHYTFLSVWCVLSLCVFSHWRFHQCSGFLMCAQMLMLVIAQGGWTLWKTALKLTLGEVP